MTVLINNYRNENAPAYCTDCAPSYLNQYRESIKLQKEQLLHIVKSNVKVIPILTAHNPLNRDYMALNMVSAQTVTGTGLLSEFTSSWSDFMGSQSGSLQDKLSQGEMLCRNQLRY